MTTPTTLGAWRTLPTRDREHVARFLDLWFDTPALRAYIFDVILDLPGDSTVLLLEGKVGVTAARLLGRMRGGELLVVEPAPELLDRSTREHLHRLAIRADVRLSFLSDPLTALGVPTGSVDRLWCHNLLTHDETLTCALLGEMRRVLTPHGVAYLREPEHLYFGLLPTTRLISTHPRGDAQLSAALTESDTGQADLSFASQLLRLLPLAGFTTPRIYPLSMTRSGPLPPEDAAMLCVVLPLLGLIDPDDSPHTDPFDPASSFYLFERSDLLLIESDLLLEVSPPPPTN